MTLKTNFDSQRWENLLYLVFHNFTQSISSSPASGLKKITLAFCVIKHAICFAFFKQIFLARHISSIVVITKSKLKRRVIHMQSTRCSFYHNDANYRSMLCMWWFPLHVLLRSSVCNLVTLLLSIFSQKSFWGRENQ